MTLAPAWRRALALPAIPILLPLGAFARSAPPTAAAALVGALGLVSIVRPAAGWLGVALLAPFGAALAHALRSPIDLTEPLVLAFLGAWLLREASRSSPASEPAPTHRGVSRWLLIFGVVVTASALVTLEALRADFWLPFTGNVVAFLARGYYTSTDAFPALKAAAGTLEGVALAAAGLALTARDPQFARRAAWTLAVAAAIVAVLTLPGLVAPGWWCAGRVAGRVSFAVADVNAAGSYFAFAVCLAARLAWRADRGRIPAAAIFLLCCAGLAASGSRTAMLAVLLTAAVTTLIRSGAGWSKTVRLTAAAGFLALAVGYVAFGLLNGRVIEPAVRWRREMSATALRMFAAHPVFGAGAGRFHALSFEYSSPEWRRHVPQENAHNNFLQVLAELGVAGFVPLLGLLHSALRAPRGAPRASPDIDGVRLGLVAFTLTWLGGHPLLSPAVSVVFWLALGVAAGARTTQTDPGTCAPALRSGRLAAWTTVAVVILSIPGRAAAERDRSDPNRLGIAVSSWRQDADGVRFRWMQRHAQIYVRTAGGALVLPVKLSGGMATVRVAIDGGSPHTADVNGARWTDVLLDVPPASRNRLIRVDVRLGVLRQRPDAEGGGTPSTAGVRLGVARGQAR
jgi:O-antigen ligase